MEPDQNKSMDSAAIYHTAKLLARSLQKNLEKLKNRKPVILSLGRRAALLADLVARELRGDSDVFLAGKLSGFDHSQNLGLAFEDGHYFLSDSGMTSGLSAEYFSAAASRMGKRLREQRRKSGLNARVISLQERAVLIMTEETDPAELAKAAAAYARTASAVNVTAVALNASDQTLRRLGGEFDEVIRISSPLHLA